MLSRLTSSFECGLTHFVSVPVYAGSITCTNCHVMVLLDERLYYYLFLFIVQHLLSGCFKDAEARPTFDIIVSQLDCILEVARSAHRVPVRFMAIIIVSSFFCFLIATDIISAWPAKRLPYSFHCLITGDVMQDPVVCDDGHTYEKYPFIRDIVGVSALVRCVRMCCGGVLQIPWHCFGFF